MQSIGGADRIRRNARTRRWRVLAFRLFIALLRDLFLLCMMNMNNESNFQYLKLRGDGESA